MKTRSQGCCPERHPAVRPTAPSQSTSLRGWDSASHLLAPRCWSQEVRPWWDAGRVSGFANPEPRAAPWPPQKGL